ncbi:hypothetical protein GLX27_003752 [Malassezia furfur]|uniref:AMP-dependent synthetase/ligase domain-containing protein n=1 Tax=Malassezia furfur TaxID=55194 RepID=A0ABY8EVU4_MALFU|nr:hypothetical protein GLX27_003752 [Malassezia furfur]
MDEIDERIRRDPACPYTMKRRTSGRPGFQLEHPFLNLGHFWLQQSEQFVDNDYVISETRRATFRDVRRASVVLAYALHVRYNIQRGDRVAIVSRNTIEFVTVFWALHLLGAVPAAVNAFQRADMVAACINMVGARMAFLDEGAWAQLTPHLNALFRGTAYPDKDPAQPALRYAIVIGEREAHPLRAYDERPWVDGERVDCRVHDWDEVMQLYHSYRGAAPPPVHTIGLDDHALILFTSGTTSVPKPVISTQDQVISSPLVSTWYILRGIVELLGSIPPADMLPRRRTLCTVPLFHVMGLESVLMSSTLYGDAFALLHKYTLPAAIAMIQREQITNLLSVGFMVQEILRSDADLPSLSGFFVGGATSSERLPDDAQKRGVATGGNGYGLTETNSGVLVNVGAGYVAAPASIGVPAPMVEVRILDPATGEFLPAGQPGELLIRAPNVAKGYYGRREATRAAFRNDGFFCTGDIAVQRADGAVFIVDRRTLPTLTQSRTSSSARARTSAARWSSRRCSATTACTTVRSWRSRTQTSASASRRCVWCGRARGACRRASWCRRRRRRCPRTRCPSTCGCVRSRCRATRPARCSRRSCATRCARASTPSAGAACCSGTARRGCSHVIAKNDDARGRSERTTGRVAGTGGRACGARRGGGAGGARARAAHDAAGARDAAAGDARRTQAAPPAGEPCAGARRVPVCQGRVHQDLHDEAQEAELGDPQDGACAPVERAHGHGVHPRRGAQPAGAQRGADARRACAGRARCALPAGAWRARLWRSGGPHHVAVQVWWYVRRRARRLTAAKRPKAPL